MNAINLDYTVDLAKKDTQVKELDRPLFFGDKNAYKLNVTVKRNGALEDLSGMTCRGYIVYEGTNTTYPIKYAGVSGNMAWVLFDEESLLVTGRAYILVQLTKSSDNFSLTLFALYGDVKLGITGTIFVPTGSILDINALTDKMEEFDEIIAGAASTISGAENVDIAMTQSDGVFNITTTNRNGQQTTAAIPDPAAEVKKKANRSSVTADRTISGTGKVEFPDALDEPMSLNLRLEPKQNLHGYDKPWVGGSGKNLLPPLELGGTVFSVVLSNGEDGSVIASGTSTKSGGRTNSYAKSKPFVLKPGTYVASNTSTTSTKLQVVVQTAADVTVLSSVVGTPFVITADTEVTVGYNLTEGSTYDGKPQYIQLEAGSTATDFEPYSNICPITGYDSVEVVSTGKNLAEFVQDMGIKQDGTVAAQNGRIATVTPIQIKNGSSYRFVVPNNDIYGILSVFNGDSLVRRIAAITTNTILNTADGDRFYFCCYDSSTGSPPITIESAKAMIIDSSETDMSYEPFGSSLSLNLISAAGGTVYGGTVTVNEDGSGELVVDRAYANGADLTWQPGSKTNSFVATGGFTITPDIHSADTVFDGETSWGYQKTSYNSIFVGSDDKQVGWRSPGGGNTQKGIIIKDSGLSSYYQSFDLSAFHQAVSDLGILYPISSVTYPLTASQINSLLGYTQVITDTDGALTVCYKTDKYAKLEKFLAAFPGDGKLVAGTDTQATRNNAVATGKRTTASGENGHAEGIDTTASGPAAHAEGGQTTASGGRAHAEGTQTVASGSYCHAEGENTVANHKAQHVFGRFNIPDDSELPEFRLGNYVEIVGNGDISTTEGITLSNARTLDWDGNEALAGCLTLGMGTEDEVTLTAAQLKALLALLS